MRNETCRNKPGGSRQNRRNQLAQAAVRAGSLKRMSVDNHKGEEESRNPKPEGRKKAEVRTPKTSHSAFPLPQVFPSDSPKQWRTKCRARQPFCPLDFGLRTSLGPKLRKTRIALPALHAPTYY